MEYVHFKNELFSRAKAYGFTDFELYFTASNSFNVEIFEGDISKYENTDEVGISFRGTFNGRMGYAFTEKIDESIIDLLIKNAAANAGIIEEKEIEKLYPGDSVYQPAKGYNPALNDLSAAEKIKTAMEMENYALSLDKRVKSMDYCVLGTGEGMTRIANSYGLDVAFNANMLIAYLEARVEENELTKTGFDFWVGNDFSLFDYKKLAERVVNIALSALGASSVASGDYQVVFNNEAARSLFSVYAPIFYAENAQKGFSLLSSNKAGTEIAAKMVTLRDDGVCEENFINVPFDSEGVATKNKTIIENGVLKTLLYNIKSAKKEGVKSTGNGFKGGFRSAVATSVTNFYLVPSKKTQDQLLSGMISGLFITDLAGLHAGANTISGDFSLSADGFLIENGKITRPVEQITVAGNFYDLLKNITDVGGDLRFGSPGAGGAMGMPSFKVKELRISGL